MTNKTRLHSILFPVLPVLLVLLALSCAAALVGCLGSDSGPTAAEKEQAVESTEQGKENFTSAFEVMTSDGFQYGESDMSTLIAAHEDFKEALRLDPANSEARFGAALTGVLVAMQSQQLASLVNETQDSPSPLDVNFTTNAPVARNAILARLAASDFPEVHELQDAVADTLLPALESAISLMQAVHGDDAFSMTLTVEGSSREIDHAEVSVLLSGFKALHALMTLVLAYDLDFDANGSYDYLDVIENIDDWDNLSSAEKTALNTLTSLLSKTSPLLAVRPAWQSRLAQVDNNIFAALGILKDGLASIRTESDPQSNDLLRLCPEFGIGSSGCISNGNLEDALNSLDSLRKYMNQPYPVAATDTTIMVNFAAYFNVQDYKKMLPHYAFYNANVWSSDFPIFYFTKATGQETGNIKTLDDLINRADTQDWPASKTVDSLKVIIHWQDPTFQGYLPGATQARVWRIIQLEMEEQERQEELEEEWLWKKGSTPRVGSTSFFLDPRLPLILLGKTGPY